MGKRRNWIRTIIVWAVLLIALGLLVWKVFIPLFSPEEEETANVVETYGYDGLETSCVLENDHLRFELDPTTTHFTVTDKRSGAVWYSSPPDADSDPIALPVEKNRMKSDITLNYSLSTGMKTMLTSNEFSVTNQVYEVVPEENAVRVNFSVGKISRTYIVPPAITETRLDSFTANMEKKQVRDLKEYYEKKSLDSLKSKDNPEELLANYPDLAENTMYILRSNVKDHVKLKLEGYFEAAGYTHEDYEYDLSRCAQASAPAAAVFNVSLLFTLEENDLVVTVPLEEIAYNSGYPIISLSVLPAFGAGHMEDEGFLLVPDGNGGVIRFTNHKTDQNPYYGNLYGWDWATLRTQVTSETSCSFPAFGISRNGASFLCLIEDGAPWAGVSADIAERYTSYNTVYNTFTLVHGDPYDVSDRTINANYLFERQLPEGKLVQRYRFLETDTAAGMALAYRDYLQHGIADHHTRVDEKTPVSVELLGAVDKVQQRFGIPTLLPVPMTTYRQAAEILDRLAADGMDGYSVRYTGWMNGGVNQKILNKVRLLSELGSEKELKAFLEKAKGQGVDVYLDGLTSFARHSGLLDGFVYVRDSAKFTTQENIELRDYSTIWYGPDTATDSYWLLKPALMEKHAGVLSDAAAKYGAAGIAYRDVGSMLSADYDRKHWVTRAQSLALHQQIMRAASEKGQKVLTHKGFDFALPVSNLAVDLDFDGGNYGIIDYYVPFYPTAIHGLANFTGSSLNLSDDWETLLLQSAESGAGLSFTFSAESAQELQSTFYSSFYGADISLVYDKALSIWRSYMEGLGDLNRVPITDFRREGSVSVVTYENGRQVFVNYGYAEAETDCVKVPARSYLVRKEGTP